MKLNIWGELIELGEYDLSVYLILISLLNLFPDIIDTVFDVYIQLYPLQIFYNDILDKLLYDTCIHILYDLIF